MTDLPNLRAETPRGRLLRPLYVLALRLSADLTQKEAGDVVHVSERTWRKWEGEEGSSNHRYPQEAFIELFCKKQGLTYPPKFNQKSDDDEGQAA